MMATNYKIGDSIKVIRKPGDTVPFYRILRVVIDMDGPDPAVTVTVAMYQHPDACRNGIEGFVYTFDHKLSIPLSQLANLDTLLFPFLRDELAILAGTEMDAHQAWDYCGVCGGLMKSHECEERHKFHNCKMCGGVWESGNHNDCKHPEGNPMGFPCPRIKDYARFDENHIPTIEEGEMPD